MFNINTVTLSDGVASGSVLNFRKAIKVEETKDVPKDKRGIERKELEESLLVSLNEINCLVDEVRKSLGDDKASIFECHADIISDEEFQNDMFSLIDEKGYSAAYAASVIAEQNALEMEELDDPYFKERAADFRDIGQRIVSHLVKEQGCGEENFPPHKAVVVAESLTPGETIRFYKPNLLGFIVAKGGKNSHAAILARSIGVPAVVVSENMLSLLKDDTPVVLNIENNTLIVNPDEKTIEKAENIQVLQEKRRIRLKKIKGKPAVTKDGHLFKLYANSGSMKDLASVKTEQPDGIGLFRTEFLFMEQSSLPNEEIQAAYYTKVLETLEGKPVIFRLLDIGGDKPLPYLQHPEEKNPFLGWRGIRFLLDNEEILRTQIRSMLIASDTTHQIVRIMVPMVSCIAEMQAVQKIIEDEKKLVGGNAIAGMMVETPAAAMNVLNYKGISHFISIGSNDLTQYTVAVDRESEVLRKLYSEFHPSVLQLMYKAVTDAREAGMETGICGEFAGRIEGAAILAGIGFDELSMSAGAIPAVKEILRSCNFVDLQKLTQDVLALPDAESVYNKAHTFLEEQGLLL
ncbi:MAG: phosphoenolpyruvate--protein phosphotransferase [Treponema sp. CETP13]|nr:MAG: phosphoenolpyruvate--protein phosphotransferase [Treponema sp. CETP13]